MSQQQICCWCCYVNKACFCINDILNTFAMLECMRNKRQSTRFFIWKKGFAPKCKIERLPWSLELTSCDFFWIATWILEYSPHHQWLSPLICTKEFCWSFKSWPERIMLAFLLEQGKNFLLVYRIRWKKFWANLIL